MSGEKRFVIVNVGQPEVERLVTAKQMLLSVCIVLSGVVQNIFKTTLRRYLHVHTSIHKYIHSQKKNIHIYIYIFIHSGYFYSTSSSPLLFGGAHDTARILCRSFIPKRHRQLRVKDLPKVATWRLELELEQLTRFDDSGHHKIVELQ